jgi:hypothetical protein
MNGSKFQFYEGGTAKTPPTPKIMGANQGMLCGIRCMRQVPEEAWRRLCRLSLTRYKRVHGPLILLCAYSIEALANKGIN